MKYVVYLGILVLAACSSGDPGNGAGHSAEIEVNTMQAVEFTGGNWERRGEAAFYLSNTGDVLLAIRCDKPAKRVSFLLAGSLPDGGSKMKVETDQASETLVAQDASVDGADTAMIEASAPLGSPFIAKLALKPQRIGIKLSGGDGFVAPGNAIVDAVISGCR
jgi:hypothetical protein